MMVTFVDNHDTGPAESCGSGQNLWPAPCGSVMEGYAYILTHPGIPTVFYPHIYNWNLKTQIADKANEWKDRATAMVQNAADRGSETMETAQDSARRVADTVKSEANNVGNAARGS